MDMLADTGQALRSYIRQCEGPVDLGSSYLLVFGALQVLYVQQDAAFWLCQAIGAPRDVAQFSGPERWIRAEGNEHLAELRNLRNSSVGHPVNRSQAPATERGSYFIVQMSLAATGFQLVARNDVGRSRRAHVPVLGLVESQLKVLTRLIRKARAELVTAERSHKKKFVGHALAATWNSVNYAIEKMHESVEDAAFRPVGTYGVDVVRRAMSDFRQELEQRDEPFGDGLVDLYGQLDCALTRLTGFFEGNDEDMELARILAVFVADRREELASWARQLDEEYALHPKPGSAPGTARRRTRRAVRKEPRE